MAKDFAKYLHTYMMDVEQTSGGIKYFFILLPSISMISTLTHKITYECKKYVVYILYVDEVVKS